MPDSWIACTHANGKNPNHLKLSLRRIRGKYANDLGIGPDEAEATLNALIHLGLMAEELTPVFNEATYKKDFAQLPNSLSLRSAYRMTPLGMQFVTTCRRPKRKAG